MKVSNVKPPKPGNGMTEAPEYQLQATMITAEMRRIGGGMMMDPALVRGMDVTLAHHYAEQLVAAMKSHIWSRKINEEVKAEEPVPATWWDHFLATTGWPEWIVKVLAKVTRRGDGLRFRKIRTMVHFYSISPVVAAFANEGDTKEWENTEAGLARQALGHAMDLLQHHFVPKKEMVKIHAEVDRILAGVEDHRPYQPVTQPIRQTNTRGPRTTSR